MRVEEYMGILTSPRAPEKQKERVRRKIMKDTYWHWKWRGEVRFTEYFIGNFINGGYDYPILMKMINEEGHYMGPNSGFIKIKMKDNRYSVSMDLEKENVSLYIENFDDNGDEIKLVAEGTYKNAKKEINRIKKKFKQMAEEVERRQDEIRLPEWMSDWMLRFKPASIYYSKVFYELSMDGLSAKTEYGCGVTIIENKDGIKKYIKNKKSQEVLGAIAANEGLVYIPEEKYTKMWEYKFLNGLDEQGKFVRIIKHENERSQEYRTRKISDSGFYNEIKEGKYNDSNIWLEPVDIDLNEYLNKYLGDFEEVKDSEKRKKKEVKQAGELEKELDNLEKIDEKIDISVKRGGLNL